MCHCARYTIKAGAKAIPYTLPLYHAHNRQDDATHDTEQMQREQPSPKAPHGTQVARASGRCALWEGRHRPQTVHPQGGGGSRLGYKQGTLQSPGLVRLPSHCGRRGPGLWHSRCRGQQGSPTDRLQTWWSAQCRGVQVCRSCSSAGHRFLPPATHPHHSNLFDGTKLFIVKNNFFAFSEHSPTAAKVSCQQGRQGHTVSLRQAYPSQRGHTVFF